MSFDRARIPNIRDYLTERRNLELGKGTKWVSTRCEFHGSTGRPMRANLESGGWICMSCGTKGGDALEYEMRIRGIDFIEAAKSLGAWVDDGKPVRDLRPAGLSARDALAVLASQANFVAVAAGGVANGVPLTDSERELLMKAAGRILFIAEEYADA